MPMNNKEKELLRGIASDNTAAKQQFLTEYLPFIAKDIQYNVRLGLVRPRDQQKVEQWIIREFYSLAESLGDELDEFSIRQILHQLVMQYLTGADTIYLLDRPVKLRGRARRGRPKVGDSGITSIVNLPSGSELWRVRPESGLVLPGTRMLAHLQEVVVDTSERMTTGFLSVVLVPYVGAISSIQQVCNAILQRPSREVTITSISQSSPMDIKFVDAAEAIKTLREDIIPWRRENAKKLAKLKEREVAADIKKKEQEALEISARSAKDTAEAEKIRAEAAKLNEEAEKLRIENDKSRFELQKEKFMLALEIVSKMQPDLPPAEGYVYAMQLLPAIDTIATSPIEPDQLLP